MTPTFSVIIPCHNAVRWIGTALRSVVDQTLPAHEVIVIDDASTDGSADAIRAAGHAVRLLSCTFHNAAAARNTGIEAATGEWIAFLDADDMWYPNHLERAAALLQKAKDVAFMAKHDWIDLAGQPIPIPSGFHWPFEQPATSLAHDAFAKILVQGFHFGHSTVVYRRRRVLEVDCFDPSQKRRHDIDLWLRVLRGHTWTCDSVKSAGYRLDTPGSISKNLADCEYYYLRALLKNEPGYDGPAMRQLIATSARRAMSLSFVDGSPDLYQKTRELAWPRIKPSFRFCYRCADACPAALRYGVRMKRWIRAAF